MQQIIEKIQTAQHGIERPFRCYLFENGMQVSFKDFATEHLAWAYGRNWEMISGSKQFDIVNQATLDDIFKKANSIYNQWLWCGTMTDQQSADLAAYRKSYLVASNGRSMPDLYKFFS